MGVKTLCWATFSMIKRNIADIEIYKSSISQSVIIIVCHFIVQSAAKLFEHLR